MEQLPVDIEEKLEKLPIIPFDGSQEFQEVIFSSDFNDIFDYYSKNYMPDVVKSKPELYQRISLYLTLTNQDTQLTNQIEEVIYRRPVPTIDEFLTGRFYSYNSNATLYPYWKDRLKEIFRDSSPIRKVIFSGSIGTGKSTVARKCFLYVLYRLFCYRNLRSVLNVDQDSTIANVVISMTLKQVYETNTMAFIKLMETMPCFQRVMNQRSFENFNLDDPHCPIPWVPEKSTGNIYFPDNIIFTCGSNSGHFTGYNVVNSFCDEISEKGVTEAIDLLNTLDNRFSSRFQGSDLVFQSVVSSARTTNSALGEYVRKLPKNDPSILILSPCLWEVKPDPNFIGDGTTFPVMVGNGSIPSKIFTDPGELKAIEDGNYEPPTGCEIIHVPTVYRSKFELQLDQSIQDIAGMTTSDNNSVFRDTTRLEESFLTPEMYFDVSIREDVDILSLLEPYNLFEKTVNDRWQFKRAPLASRYCFVGNTKVSTLDGKEKTMKELAEDFDKGVKNWVYSWDNERGWSIGEIVFAGITSYGKKLCKVTLDNGEIIECTPDHKFMTRNGEYIKAKDLTNGTSLMPLYRKMSKIVSFKRKTYEQLKDNRTQDYIFTHKLSADVYCENKVESIQKAKERKSFVVRHHKDFNATNNNPDNLVYMESRDHFALHSKRGTDHFTKLWSTEEFKNKMKQVSSTNGKLNGYKDMMNKWYGPENEKWREYLRPIQAKNGRKCFLKYNKTNEHRKKAREVLRKQRKDPEFNKKIMIGRIKACIAYLMSRGFSIDEESWILAKNCPQYIRYDTALKYVDNLESVKDNLVEYNHKVKSIELIELDESIPLYDLTIKDKYNCHNFALSAGVVVSNCHVDLSSGGSEGQCDTGLCVGHKEWRMNPNTKEKEVIYVVDLQLFINAKNKVDIHAIQTFLINLVTEKNIPVHTVSFDQYNSLMIMQQLEASGCFVNVEKVSVDVKLEPYTNAASLMEKGQVKIGRAPKLKKELEALIIDKGKVTRTTELKDGPDSLVGMIWDAQMNYADFPVYEFEDPSSNDKKVDCEYSDLIDPSSEFVIELN